MLAYLHKHILLDPVKLSSESAHRICQVLHELASQLAIDLTWSGLGRLFLVYELLDLGLLLISHSQVQDLPILLLKKMLSFGQVSLHLFKGCWSRVDYILGAVIGGRARLSHCMLVKNLTWLMEWLAQWNLLLVVHLGMRWLLLLHLLLLVHLMQWRPLARHVMGTQGWQWRVILLVLLSLMTRVVRFHWLWLQLRRVLLEQHVIAEADWFWSVCQALVVESKLLVELARLRWLLINFGSLYSDEFGRLKASLILLFEHVDFKIVMLLQKA